MSHRRLSDVYRDEMERLVAQHTDEEIGKMFNVTKQRVHARRGEYDPPIPRAGRGTYREYIPWVVDNLHQGHYLARMLRLHARYNTGEELTEKAQRMLAVFWTQCDYLSVAWCDFAGPVVVDYDRDHPEGFFLVRARAGEGYIRRPGAAA